MCVCYVCERGRGTACVPNIAVNFIFCIFLLVLSATLLAHKAVFWTKETSPVLTYNSACTAEDFASPTNGSSPVASSLVASVMAAIVALIFRA